MFDAGFDLGWCSIRSEQTVIGAYYEGLSPAVLLAASHPDRVRAAGLVASMAEHLGAGLFGGLGAGLAIAGAVIEAVVIVSAPGEGNPRRRSAHRDGVPAALDGSVAAAVDGALGELGSDRTRRKGAGEHHHATVRSA